MIETIYNFLSNFGNFPTIDELLSHLIIWVLKLFYNISSLFLQNIFVLIEPYLPDMSPIYSGLSYLYNTLLPYCQFAVDATLLPRWVLIYILSSLIFRISVNRISVIQNIILNIYNKLKL